MQAGPKTSNPAAFDAKSEEASDPAIFFVDLTQSKAALDAEEVRTPRLSAADIERASKISDTTARHLWRASRIATRLVLERLGGPGLRGVPFHIEDRGRPVLGEGQPHFSVSHSGGAALIAVSRHAAVGVDLEARTRTLRMSGDRRGRLVAAAERITSEPPLSANDDEDVLTAWVQLEAVAKATGLGIGRLLTLEGVVGGLRRRETENLRYGLTVRCLTVGASYIAAIAAKRLSEDLAVEFLPVDDLERFSRGKSG